MRILMGDALAVLRTLPDQLVQCVITSPPYWGLRDYSRCGCAIGTVKQDETGNRTHEGFNERWALANGKNRQHLKELGERDGSGGGAKASSPTKAPDPSCPKCHGTGKDESLTVIWDAKEGCEHEWEVKRYYTERGAGASGAEAFQDPGAANVDRIKKSRWRSDANCVKCGAWRGQLGLEPTPELYVKHLVDIFHEVRRVLRDDGTLWLNMGDCYAGGGGGNYGSGISTYGGTESPHTTSGKDKPTVPPGLKPKDLLEIPSRIALALQHDGWFLRSRIPWIKRNAMPESVEDRPASAVEYIFLLAKSADYFYDGFAVRGSASQQSMARIEQSSFETQTGGPKDYAFGTNPNRSMRRTLENFRANPGRNRRNADWFMDSWQGLLTDETDAPLAMVVNPSGYKEAHFATFPTKLVEPCIKAGTSEYGACPTCGTAWERVVESTKERIISEPVRVAGGDENGLYHGSEVKAYDETFAQRPSDAKRRILEAMTHPLQSVGFRPTCSCYHTEPWPDYPDEPGCLLGHDHSANEGGDCDSYDERQKVLEDARKAWVRWSKSFRTAEEPAIPRPTVQDLAYDSECKRIRDERVRLVKKWKPLARVPCIVLDPFAGSGTVGQVARDLGRSAILIEIKSEYVELAKRRCGIVVDPPEGVEAIF